MDAAPEGILAAAEDTDPGADGEVIRPGRFQFQNQPVPASPGLVAEQLNRPIVVIDDDVDGAVIIDVPECNPPADLSSLKGRTGRRGRLAQPFTAALIVEQLASLGIRKSAPLTGPHDRNATVRNKQVEPATTGFGLLQPTFGFTGFGAGWLD